VTWGGAGTWGAGAAWGTGGGEDIPAPTLAGVSTTPPPLAIGASPAVVAERGGTVATAFGTNFFDPLTIDILDSFSVVVANGYVFDPEFDLQQSRVIFGVPALEVGLYGLRITTASGTTGILTDAIESRLFAEEYKTLSVRGKYSRVWKTGPRILREG
jgi:hypothetical protein